MVKIFLTSVVLLLLIVPSYGQNLKKVSRLIEKAEYDKVKETLDKAILKDSSHFGLMYYYSLYYLNRSEAHYNLDSARAYIFKSVDLRPNATDDQNEDWEKTEIDLANIDSAKILITKLSFEKAQNPISLSSIVLFYDDSLSLH